MKPIWTIITLASVIAILVCVAVGLSFSLGYYRGRTASARIDSRAANGQPEIQVVGLSREAILQMLPGKTWYTHWENKERNRPTTFSLDNEGEIVGESGKPWRIELRWVLNEGVHLFVPMDEYNIEGFFIPSGRQKGYFADKPTITP